MTITYDRIGGQLSRTQMIETLYQLGPAKDFATKADDG